MSPDGAVLELDPTFNVRHSNSAGLPDIDGDNSSHVTGKVTAKEKDHFDFLN